MTTTELLLLGLTAVLGGAINSVAGGGSFFTFPALIFTGMPSVPANATSNTALWPGSVASAVAYRHELRSDRRLFLTLLTVSLVGSTAGAILLVTTPSRIFLKLVPALMLVASVVFTFGSAWQRRLSSRGAPRMSLTTLCAIQLVIAVYGGYFGGGQGFMMLALLTFAHVGDIHHMNAFKSVLAAVHNGVGVVVFVVVGAVVWQPALVMMLGAVAGGYAGARLARRLNPVRVKHFVVVVAWLMTAEFIRRSWL
ncbi:MAG: sulfite exporter TauE/SafE family protein [Myxococcota bacterium]